MGGRIWLLAVVSKWLSNSKVASGLLSLSERPPGRRVAVAWQSHILLACTATGAVADLVGIRVGVVSGVINLESSGVEASDWRLRHDQGYHEV
jgi:hypothetical protein